MPLPSIFKKKSKVSFRKSKKNYCSQVKYTGKIYIPDFHNLNVINFQADTGTNDNASVKRQLNNDGFRKSLASFGSQKTENFASNYANNNTASPHNDKSRNQPLLPLEGFPDPPYEDEVDHTEAQTRVTRLCRNFQDVLGNADTFDSGALSRPATPSQSSYSEFTSLIQYFQQVRIRLDT